MCFILFLFKDMEGMFLDIEFIYFLYVYINMDYQMIQFM